MIRVMGAQGSGQWMTARCGIPTASRFSSVLSPKKLQPSTSAKPYMHELLAEWVFGEPIDQGSTEFMDRGRELEDMARKAYVIQNDVQVEEVGLCLTGSRHVGCSPDGLIGHDGGLEIKTPGLKNHIRYMLDPGALVDEYRLQVHGSMFVCDRDWWDIMSYNPALPDVFVRVDRDAKIDNAIEEALGKFCEQLEEAKQKMIEMGVEPDPRPMEARAQVAERVAA